ILFLKCCPVSVWVRRAAKHRPVVSDAAVADVCIWRCDYCELLVAIGMLQRAVSIGCGHIELCDYDFYRWAGRTEAVPARLLPLVVVVGGTIDDKAAAGFGGMVVRGRRVQ